MFNRFMLSVLMWRMLIADQPDSNKGGQDEYEILDNLVIPKTTRGGGARGSKYLGEKEENMLTKIKAGQGFKIPLMGNADSKDAGNVTPKRQRYATKFRIDEWVQEHYMDRSDPAKPVLQKDAPKFTVALLDDGIAVRRDA